MLEYLKRGGLSTPLKPQALSLAYQLIRESLMHWVCAGRITTGIQLNLFKGVTLAAMNNKLEFRPGADSDLDSPASAYLTAASFQSSTDSVIHWPIRHLRHLRHPQQGFHAKEQFHVDWDRTCASSL